MGDIFEAVSSGLSDLFSGAGDWWDGLVKTATDAFSSGDTSSFTDAATNTAGSAADVAKAGGDYVTAAANDQGSMWDKALGWFEKLPPGGQNILLAGTVGAAKALMGGPSAGKLGQEAMDLRWQQFNEDKRRYEQAREDAVRKNAVPELQHGDANRYQTAGNPSGIVNAALGGPGYQMGQPQPQPLPTLGG